MHIIDMAYNDMPVRVKFNRAGLVTVTVDTKSCLLFRASMTEVMTWVKMLADQQMREVNIWFCQDCGARCPDKDNCIECGEFAF
jgi:hypothetical protein